MTRYDAGHRLLDEIKKHHERELAKYEMQFRLKSAYADELEDVIRHDSVFHVIAIEMIAKAGDCSEADAVKMIADEYKRRQKAGVTA